MIAAAVRGGIRRSLRPLLPTLRLLRRLPSALRAREAARTLRPHSQATKVCYLTPNFPSGPPARNGIARGGMVKLTEMERRFPHAFPAAAALYGVSSVFHPDAVAIVDAAQQRGVHFVLNQNGVYYPAWFGDAWEEYNGPLSALLHRADYVVYQSEFCQRAAEKFLGVPRAPSCVLYNPIDLAAFRPRPAVLPRPLTMLTPAAGTHRTGEVDAAVETLRIVRATGTDVHLLIAGYSADVIDDVRMMRHVTARATDARIPPGRIRFLPRYSREEAPGIFGLADVFLHTVYNDSSPNVVGEALASGLPVVHSASGGTPEIVGPAGVGIPAPEDWEVMHPPSPAALAEAVSVVAENLAAFSEMARSRAESLLNRDLYLQQHETILRELAA